MHEENKTNIRTITEKTDNSLTTDKENLGSEIYKIFIKYN